MRLVVSGPAKRNLLDNIVRMIEMTMKRIVLYAFLSLLPLAASAGMETNIPLAIYATTNTSPWDPPRDPNVFALAEQPILTDADFVSYDWPTHTFTLQSNSISKLPAFSSGGQQIIFVVVAYGQRCYVGQFRPLEDAAPYPLDFPTIRVWADSRMRNKTTKIAMESRGQSVDGRSNDPRSDPRVLDALKKASKLRSQKEDISELTNAPASSSAVDSKR